MDGPILYGYILSEEMFTQPCLLGSDDARHFGKLITATLQTSRDWPTSLQAQTISPHGSLGTDLNTKGTCHLMMYSGQVNRNALGYDLH